MSDTNKTLSIDGRWPESPDERLAIDIHRLQYCFGQGELRKQVLFDNNLEIQRGEIVIMTGPSGSGKTTLLTLIGTLRSVQEGSLKLLGNQLRSASASALVRMRRQIGFIFQAHNLFASLTAMQNVRMAMELFDLSSGEMKTRATDLLTRLGLAERIDYKPGKLSGGQKQRVAIARALAHRPDIILADEPTAALDEQSGREVVTLLQELAQEQKCTILMVTHDNRILDVADRIINMVDGRIKSNVVVDESAAICEFLGKCPAFAGLTAGTLAQAADRMTRESYRPGETIIREGDPGDKFYIVRSGTAFVRQQEETTDQPIAQLTSGDFFGEMALLTGQPRSASVAAHDDVEVYALGKDDFNAVIAASASFDEELRKALFERQ